MNNNFLKIFLEETFFCKSPNKQTSTTPRKNAVWDVRQERKSAENISRGKHHHHHHPEPRQLQLQGSLTFIFMETYDFRKTPMCNARKTRRKHMEEIFHRIWELFSLVSLWTHRGEMDESFPCLSLIKCGDVEPHNQRRKQRRKENNTFASSSVKTNIVPIDHASAHIKHTLAIHSNVSIVPSSAFWYTY